MAGMAGLEPTNDGVKVRCLTAWLHPYAEDALSLDRYLQSFSQKGLQVMGWVKGLEPSTPGTTIRCSNQLSYTHHMARQKGFEPLTYCLEGSCSIQLSYWRIWSG